MLNATRPLVSLYAISLGGSTVTVGLLASTYAFFPLLLAISIGKLTDRFGIRRPVIVGTIGLAIALVFPFLFPSLWALYVSQGMVGVAQIFINVSLQNAIGFASKDKRDRNFSIYSLGISGGAFLGPVIGGFIGEHLGFAATFLCATIFSLIPISISFFLPDFINKKEGLSKSNKIEGKFQTFTLLKLPTLRKALFTSMLVLYSRDIYMAYFPLYASSIGIATFGIGLIMSIQGGASVAIRSALPWLIQRWARDKVLFLSLIAAGISFTVVPLLNQMYWFWGLAILLGAGLGCGQPLSTAITFNVSPMGRTGEALGLRMAFNRLSQFIAPFVFAMIGGIGGLSSVFYVSGLFLIGGSILTNVNKEGGNKNVTNNY